MNAAAAGTGWGAPTPCPVIRAWASIPACPAGIDHTRMFCRERWRTDLDVHRYQAVLYRRAAAVGDLRVAGDGRAAEVIGWLTLAGMLVGVGAGTLQRICIHHRPQEILDAAVTAMDPHGLVPAVGAADPDPIIVATPSGLSVPAVVSPAGWALASAAGAAAGPGTLVVAGRPQDRGTVRAELTRRIAAAEGSFR